MLKSVKVRKKNYLCSEHVKHNTMKKNLLPLLVFALVTSALYAQDANLYSIFYHEKPGFSYYIGNPFQQRDGDYILDTYLYENIGYNQIPFGYMIYKVSPSSHAITDSLLVDGWEAGTTFLTRDPSGEGNIRAIYEYHEDCDSTFVRLTHFPDNDLHHNPAEDIVAPLCDGLGYAGHSLFDRNDDLITTYYKPITEQHGDQYMARIGLDGTLKHQALLIENHFTNFEPLREFKDSPLQYFQWYGAYDPPYSDFTVYVIDSLFNTDTVPLNGILREELLFQHPYDSSIVIIAYEHLIIDYGTEVISAGGNDILVAAQYAIDTNFSSTNADRGVAVAKYDLVTKRLKCYAVFNDFHWYGSDGSPMGLKMLDDGTVYFLYKEHGYPEESINIVKMNANLNVEWKRFCKTQNINMYWRFNSPIAIEDEAGEEIGVAWTGGALKDGNYDINGWVYFMLNHDGPVDVDDNGIVVRPYAFWPNPAKGILNLQYSPDVTPTRIELYDLQGRLVRRQTTTLESINMEGLAAGTYMMRVTLQGGKVFSDKVVKE